jgi:AcrR family transcriptional regulator
MGKGEQTRTAILDRAVGLASAVGLEGLTIGRLASEAHLSKSGLFAHFASKEALQVRTLDRAAERFVEVVVKPALAAGRGEPRVRALFERWLRWPVEFPQPGGCIFVAASAELDDRPGPARDRLAQLQREWLDALARSVRVAKEEGHFRAEVDPEQFAFETYGIMLMTHLSMRLLRDRQATARARRAFERLLEKSKA